MSKDEIGLVPVLDPVVPPPPLLPPDPWGTAGMGAECTTEGKTTATRAVSPSTWTMLQMSGSGWTPADSRTSDRDSSINTVWMRDGMLRDEKR